MPLDSEDEKDHRFEREERPFLAYHNALCDIDADDTAAFASVANKFMPLDTFDTLTPDEAQSILETLTWLGEWAWLVYEHACWVHDQDMREFGYGGGQCFHPGARGPFVETCVIGNRGDKPDPAVFAILYQLQRAAMGGRDQ